MLDDGVTVEDFESITSTDTLDETIVPQEAASRKPRRSLRAIWLSFDEERRAGIMAIVFSVSIVGTLAGLAFGSLAIWQHNGRTQAVQRAKKMDGETFTIKGVSWNWIGDTRLFLENERGEDAGWVMIHMNNPFTSKVNPLYLAFSEKRHEPLPFPMKVRTHYRPEAWEDEPASSHQSDRKENFTGSFIEFEQLDQKE
jgi:hypothetical protein